MHLNSTWSMSRFSLGLKHADWKVRFAVLDKLKPSLETLPLIVVALDDS